MLRIFAKKRSIFILRCNVLNFGGFVSCNVILVCTDDCAFKFVTCDFSDGVNDIVAYAVRIRAVGHCNEQVVGLGYLDFVDCEAAVQSYGGYCAELSAVECFSENDVCNIHLGCPFCFKS